MSVSHLPLQLQTVYTFSPLTSTVAGNIRFVGNAVSGAADDAAHGKSPSRPWSTLDYAVTNAGAGATIYLLPSHAENIASATALNLDVAGQKVIGAGYGLQKPTITLTTHVGATVNISAASVWLENVKVVGNFLNIAAAITVAATANGLTLKDVETRDTSAVLGALIQISIAAGTTDVTIDGYRHYAFAGGLTAAATNVILAAGASDRFSLTNARINAHTSAAPVALSAAASKNIYINEVDLLNTETGAGLGIAAHNSTTGFVDNVVTVNLKDTVKGVTGTGLSIGPNVRYSNAVGAYAGLYSYAADS
jgi:hypothetical protein